jgi:hypothetical protein
MGSRPTEREVASARLRRDRFRGVPAHVLRQLAERDALPIREYDRALDHVLELAHVARPGVADELCQRVVSDAPHVLAERRSKAREEVVHEQRDVLASRRRSRAGTYASR